MGRAIRAVAQDQEALRLMGANPVKIKQWAFGIATAVLGIAGALLIIVAPVEPTLDRAYIGRTFCVVVMAGLGSMTGTLIAAIILGVAETIVLTMFGASWAPAISFAMLLGVLAVRPQGLFGRLIMSRNSTAFWIGAAVFLVAVLLMTQLVRNEYPFFAGYVILQFVVLAVAWSILGGYAGYVNFGTSAFFGVGVYTAVFLFKATGAPLAVQIAAAAVVGALLGFAVGLLTLRMQGIFFSIATIALTIVIETSVTNWRFVGGAAGIQMQRPPVMPPFETYVQMLFFVQALLVVLAIAIARYIQSSWIGRGLQALKDDELAAECTGVPTLRLKVMACVISGALMCAAGAPAAMYLQYADPSSAFNLNYSVSVLAMSLIGGTAHWAGPVIGAILLGTTQQLLTVTISSEVNVLVLGIMLVLFVVVAPEGLIGLVRKAGPQARGRRSMTSCRTRSALAADRRTHQALRRLHRAGQCQRRYSRRRAAWPDRPERLGQDDADQLHLRRVPHRARHRGVPRRGRHAAAAAYAHPPRHRAQFSDPAAVQEHDGGRKPDGGARFRDGGRRLRPGRAPARHRDVDPGADRPRVQGRPADHRAQPGRIAQDGARPRDGDASEALDFRRGHGRPFRLRKSMRCSIS